MRPDIENCLAALRTDQPIDAIEKVESELKQHVRELLGGGPESRALAADILGRVGLIPKVKSYAIKAAHPSGYSIFLQEQGSGFSFQRHPTSKVELFQILVPREGAMVFKMPYTRWAESVDDERMRRWLAGGSDAELDSFTVRPQPGDVFTVETTNDVHTVLGCYLEEFATNSSDLVHRLHDQNIGRIAPPHFSFAYMSRVLDSLPDVTPQRFWELTPDGWTHRAIVPEGSIWRVRSGVLTATWVRLDAHRELSLETHASEILLARVSRGSGRLIRQNGAATNLRRGDCFVLLDNETAVIVAAEPLALSVHQTPLRLALFE